MYGAKEGTIIGWVLIGLFLGFVITVISKMIN